MAVVAKLRRFQLGFEARFSNGLEADGADRIERAVEIRAVRIAGRGVIAHSSSIQGRISGYGVGGRKAGLNCSGHEDGWVWRVWEGFVIVEESWS